MLCRLISTWVSLNGLNSGQLVINLSKKKWLTEKLFDNINRFHTCSRSTRVNEAQMKLSNHSTIISLDTPQFQSMWPGSKSIHRILDNSQPLIVKNLKPHKTSLTNESCRYGNSDYITSEKLQEWFQQNLWPEETAAIFQLPFPLFCFQLISFQNKTLHYIIQQRFYSIQYCAITLGLPTTNLKNVAWTSCTIVTFV